MSFGLTEKSYDLLMKTLKSYNEIEKACIFGSRARGNCDLGKIVNLNPAELEVLNQCILEKREKS